MTLGTLDLLSLRYFLQRRRKRNKRERKQDLESGAQMTLSQQPKEDEALSGSALAPPWDEATPCQSELWDVLLAACRAGDVGMLKDDSLPALDPGVLPLLSAPLGSGGFTSARSGRSWERCRLSGSLQAAEAGADPTVQ